MARKNELYHEYITDMSPDDVPGSVRRLLHDARQHRVPMGVASSSRNAVPVLQRLGLIDQFDTIGDATMPTRRKPEPDIFVWVAGTLRLSPLRCIVFEDAPAGVTGALAGLFTVVAVGDAVADSRAHHHVATLADVTWQQVERWVAGLDG